MGQDRKNKFLIKRSNVSGKIPGVSDLTLGELALNTNDVKLYSKDSSDNSIKEIGWDRLNLSGGTLTGDLNVNGDVSATNLIGDGSQITNINSDQNGNRVITDFTVVSSSGQNFASTTNGVLLANDGLGGTTRPKATGIFSYDATNFWFDVSNLFSTGALACSIQFRVKLVPQNGNGFFDVGIAAYSDRNNLAGSLEFENSNGLVRAQPNTGLPANPSPIFNILSSENIDVLRVFTYSQNNNETTTLNLFQIDYKLYF